jgi:hypothetical protein
LISCAIKKRTPIPKEAYIPYASDPRNPTMNEIKVREMKTGKYHF